MNLGASRWAGMLASACSAASMAATAPSEFTLEGSAPSILAELAPRWAADYSAAQTGMSVVVRPPYGPPQGALSTRLQAFLEGQLDFAFVSRKLADSDLATFRRAHHFEPLIIPVAGGSWNHFGFVDPVVVIVNAHNPVTGLSYAELDAIFSKSLRRGHAPLRTWGQLGWHAARTQPIHLAGGASWSKEDTARGGVFRERVMLGGSWRDDPSATANGAETDVPATVAMDSLAIGFTGLGHIVRGDRVVPIATRRTSAYVAPTFDTVASGRYPLARTVDLIVARVPGTCLQPALLGFIRYLLSPRGQSLVRKDDHFLSLTSAQTRQSWLRASYCA